MAYHHLGDWTTVYVVMCLDDDSGEYVQATRRRFALRSDAEAYAAGIAIGRKAVVVEVPR